MNPSIVLLSFAAIALFSTVQSYSGEGTYFIPGLGACGGYNDESDLIVGLAAPDFDQYTPRKNPNKNKLCGRRILVAGPLGSVTVEVVDRCPTCQSGDLNLSPAAFSQIGDKNEGRIPITWEFA